MAKRLVSKRNLLIGAIVLSFLVTAICIVTKKPGDACSAQDRLENNCVPAGRCTPLGDPREATMDCDIKQYDHVFKVH